MSPAAVHEARVGPRLVRVTTPAPRDVWRDVAASDPLSLATQTPEWVDAHRQLGGYEDASRLYETEDGRRLVLPAVRRRGLDGALAVRSSFGEGWGMGGVVAAGGARDDDVALVAAELLAAPGLRTLVRPNPLLAAVWERALGHAALAVPRFGHVLDLDGGFDQLWNRRFKRGVRRDVQRAEAAGVTVERGNSEEHLTSFLRLRDEAVERWAARQHEPLRLARLRTALRDPPAKFRLLAEVLGDDFVVWVASRGGEPVAATIVLGGANHHCTRAVSSAEGRTTSASYLLETYAIRAACEAGCRHYHFGESGRSASLAFFKSRFGSDGIHYAEYRIERLPLTAADRLARTAVKQAIGFRDPPGDGATQRSPERPADAVRPPS